ncbi:MAG: hypothetical protein HOP10_10650 [Chitinophagaceae bacterium]|nr:hypothetical protein [Chitinophagaceae bacterium]
MNKYIPYVIGILLAGALVILFFTAESKKKWRFNENVTLKRQDKIPYGTWAAYENLQYIFPNAAIHTNKYEPGYWDSISINNSKQALIIVCPSFRADSYEMQKMIRFAENGNDVFISTRYISAAADKILQCNSSAYDLSYITIENLADSMKIKLEGPPFAQPLVYTYPGKTFNTFFASIDSNTTEVLGQDEYRHANFIHLRAGKGNFYVHTEPLAFTNYFILHKNNKEYYEKALSVINPDVTRVVWDEYYLDKKEQFEMPEYKDKKKGWFRTLLNLKNDNDQKSFGVAFWLLILLLLLYVLLGMRRKQRHIPVIAKPRNDSLDFVKTIGRLYYDRGDHKNLCKKMAAYFLEHVRNKYKLPTGTLDDSFISQLRFKTGAPESELRGIVSFIKYLEDEPIINSGSLTDFHKQLESFYKKA